jgi:hypothetical protein
MSAYNTVFEPPRYLWYILAVFLFLCYNILTEIINLSIFKLL